MNSIRSVSAGFFGSSVFCTALPERFANGVSGACKLPYVYMPFGVGPHICAGQHFARAELKILLALIVSNSFSLSPKYRHSPAMSLLIEPEHGVNLLIKKLWAMSQLSYYSWYCWKFSYLMMKLLIKSVLNDLCWNLFYDKVNAYIEVHGYMQGLCMTSRSRHESYDLVSWPDTFPFLKLKWNVKWNVIIDVYNWAIFSYFGSFDANALKYNQRYSQQKKHLNQRKKKNNFIFENKKRTYLYMCIIWI